MTQLAYETMVHEGLPRQREQRLPDGSAIVSSPVTSALIYGAHDAVLADRRSPATRCAASATGSRGPARR